jgi:hypothetical protein
MRRYDKRKYNGRSKSANKPGRKPRYIKLLGRYGAGRILEQFDAIAPPEQIYAYLWEQKRIAEMIQMRQNAENRLMGKPYTAENPEAKQKANVFLQDNRLQVAIQNLLPPTASPGAQKLITRRHKALPAAVTIEANPDVQAKADGPIEPEGD